MHRIYLKDRIRKSVRGPLASILWSPCAVRLSHFCSCLLYDIIGDHCFISVEVLFAFITWMSDVHRQ